MKRVAARVERHVAKSLDELPPEVRKRVLGMTGGDPSVRSATVYTLQDGDGQERTYPSLDEMPPEVREAFENMPKVAGAKSPGAIRLGDRIRTGRGADAFGPGGVVGEHPAGLLAFWLGGVLVAGVLVGCGLAALVSMRALGASAARSGGAITFLGMSVGDGWLRALGSAACAVGGILHIAFVWGSAAGRRRRFVGLRIFIAVMLAAFLFANLETLSEILRAYGPRDL